MAGFDANSDTLKALQDSTARLAATEAVNLLARQWKWVAIKPVAFLFTEAGTMLLKYLFRKTILGVNTWIVDQVAQKDLLNFNEALDKVRKGASKEDLIKADMELRDAARKLVKINTDRGI